jgi:hypothetical protein
MELSSFLRQIHADLIPARLPRKSINKSTTNFTSSTLARNAHPHRPSCSRRTLRFRPDPARRYAIHAAAAATILTVCDNNRENAAKSATRHTYHRMTGTRMDSRKSADSRKATATLRSMGTSARCRNWRICPFGRRRDMRVPHSGLQRVILVLCW